MGVLGISPSPRSEIPEERGWRLACAALQRAWLLEADRQPITQVTTPDDVHAFIAPQPGLEPTCRDHVPYLIAYAPQLVIRGFASQFDDAIESLYEASRPEWQRRRATNDPFATALTLDNTPPQCDEEFALRAPDFGGYSPGRSLAALYPAIIRSMDLTFATSTMSITSHGCSPTATSGCPSRFALS